MGIIAGFMVPHPPMIVPDIGRGSEAQIADTTAAYERVADEIAALAPDTIVITRAEARAEALQGSGHRMSDSERNTIRSL